ncbi:MAG TPA: hypothetical protein VFO65_03420, partial [Acidimicrobiales bacterium]|nr:hypothetical protein [Acidimicrobiales bacterium]
AAAPSAPAAAGRHPAGGDGLSGRATEVLGDSLEGGPAAGDPAAEGGGAPGHEPATAAQAAGAATIRAATGPAPVVAAPAVPTACQPTTGRIDGVDLWQVGCGRPTVFYLHAFGEKVGAWYRPDLLAALAGAGFGVVAGNLGGDTWGNEVAMAELEGLVAAYGDGGPSRFLAMSMGGATLLNYARHHPGGVKAAVGLIPVTTWTILLGLIAGPQPPLPTEVHFPYTVWQGDGDLVTGPVAVPAEVRRFTGGHDGSYPFPVQEIARILR